MKQIIKPVVDMFSDDLGEKLLTDNYTENLWEMYTTGKKISPQLLVETSLRAERGRPIARPFGSPFNFSDWNKLLFNPVHLKRLPTTKNTEINTRTIIGPEAEKPLEIDIPIIISGMSYGGALSMKSKVALAKASSIVKTATNSGEAPLVKEERKAADKFILQYNRGGWATAFEDLREADMIEIQLGQGAQAGAPMTTPAKQIDSEMRAIFKLDEGEDAVIHSRLPGVDSSDDFIVLVNDLQKKLEVPVGLKIAATNYLEEELEIAVKAGVDYIAIDGASGGTHGGPTILQDNMGLPTLPALVRTVEFLEERGVKERVSVLAAGGLLSPGHFLKALALGADAVYIGTIAMLALVHTEGIKGTPWEPPTSVVLYSGDLKEDLNVEKAANNLANYLKSSVAEMKLAIRAVGKEDIKELNKNDLCSTNRELAERLGVDWVYGN